MVRGTQKEVKLILSKLTGYGVNTAKVLEGINVFFKELAALGDDGVIKFWKHIDGEITLANDGLIKKGKGIHNYQKVLDGEIKIKGQTIPPYPKNDEPFIAKVQIRDPNIPKNWINKSNSTIRIAGKQERMATSFFPQNWSIPRIKFEIGFASGNKRFIEETITEQGVLVETYRGKCSIGWEIEFIYNDGIIKTIVPIVKGF